MSNSDITSALRPDYDAVIQDITDYVLNYDATQSALAMETARYCWMDTIGCGLFALNYPDCTNLLGPVVPEASMPGGARVPGTSYELDPVRAAWNIGAMVRWLDYNDTWLSAEWSHPSDNLGAILALADYQSRTRSNEDGAELTMKDVITSLIKAYEIQGVIALENAFNRVGLDHVILVRIASTAVAAMMLECDRDQILSAVSHAWLDGCSLRTYRQAPNTGPRKSWAAGDACSRGLFLALTAKRGETGYPSAISDERWGFQQVLFDRKELVIDQDYGSYVMENILFKTSFPAEFHGQTAVEAAMILHKIAGDRLTEIQKVVIQTQESGNRIINKTGPLNNPADRDHCLQYMVAVPLIFGRLGADDYEHDVACDPRIDALRKKILVVENQQFSREYLHPDKRSIANAVQVWFQDGTATENLIVHYPLGHRRRRAEGIPLLKEKFERSIHGCIQDDKSSEILSCCDDQKTFENTTVDRMMTLLTA